MPSAPAFGSCLMPLLFPHAKRRVRFLFRFVILKVVSGQLLVVSCWNGFEVIPFFVA
jgi:hypothetical protein